MTQHPIDGYVSPLASRFASPQMQAVWSPRTKFGLWRRLWLALAEAEQSLGLDISDEQLDGIRDNIDVTPEQLERAAEIERELRHDVMAHVHLLGELAPASRAIIHLGATSQFVNCNAETILLRDALQLTCDKVARAIDVLADLAETHRDLATLAFTHYQPAQPTTCGRRFAGWAYDLTLCLERLERTTAELRLRGTKGATGTQASFLRLFEGDSAKVEQLDRLVCEKLGFDADHRLMLTGQTYPRVIDAFVLGELASLAACAHKICNDIRLLSNRKEADEPVASAQIGSSAMPYKQNPMRCERATGLCRFVMNLAPNAIQTAATQWFERTLDDSANRRLSLPEAFLAIDGVLDLLHNVGSGLVVHEGPVRANLRAEMPFMATENIMMEAVKKGQDRQDVHEAIRKHSRAAGAVVKDEGKPNDLLERLAQDPLLAGIDVEGLLDPSAYIGLAAAQVDRFLEDIASPIRHRYRDRLAPPPELSV